MLSVDTNYKQVESHLTWLEDLLKGCGKSLENVVKKLEELELKSLEAAATSGNVEGEEKNEICYHLLNLKPLIFPNLDQAALYIKSNQFDQAVKVLNDVKNRIPKLVGDHKRLQRAVGYAVESMMWQIQIQKSSQESFNNPSNGEMMPSSNLLEENMVRLQEKFRKLMANKKSRAVIEYMQISLNMVLDVSSLDEKIKQLKEVVALDPDYFVWNRFLYNNLRARRIRSSVPNNNSKMYVGPCEDEKQACNSLYNLRPSVLLNMFSMATMLKESLWSKSLVVSFLAKDNLDVSWNAQEIADYKRCLQLLSDALEIAKFLGSQRWMLKIKLEQACILLYLKYQDPEMVEEGTAKLLEECPVEFSDSSLVFNRIGKYYKTKARLAQEELMKCTAKAQQNFKLALVKNPGDFQTLLDYLHFLNFHPHVKRTDYVDLMKIMDKAKEAEKTRSEREYAKLDTLRGCLIWIFNPQSSRPGEKYTTACEIWINVMKKYPDYRDNLFKILREPPFTLNGSWGRKLTGKVNHLYLVIELNDMRKELEENKEHRDEETLQAIFNLWIMGNMNLPDPPPEPIEKEVAERNLLREQEWEPWNRIFRYFNRNNSGNTRSNGTGYQPRGRGINLADSVDNWRARK